MNGGRAGRGRGRGGTTGVALLPHGKSRRESRRKKLPPCRSSGDGKSNSAAQMTRTLFHISSEPVSSLKIENKMHVYSAGWETERERVRKIKVAATKVYGTSLQVGRREGRKKRERETLRRVDDSNVETRDARALSLSLPLSCVWPSLIHRNSNFLSKLTSEAVSETK